MGTKLTELRDGCFHRAMDDEPMFVLLGRDPVVPEIVRTWAALRQIEIEQGKRPASDMDQVNEARATADKMEAWRRDNDGAWRTGLFGAPQPVSIMPEKRLNVFRQPDAVHNQPPFAVHPDGQFGKPYIVGSTGVNVLPSLTSPDQFWSLFDNEQQAVDWLNGDDL